MNESNPRFLVSALILCASVFFSFTYSAVAAIPSVADIAHQVNQSTPTAGSGAGAGAGNGAGSGAGANAGAGAGYGGGTTSLDPDDDPSGSSNQSGGAQCGTLRFTKYVCPEGVTVTRATNGPELDGDHVAPNACTRQQGVRFGYIYEPSKAVGDMSGPFTGMDDATPFTPLPGYTNILGRLTVTNLVNVSGRYALAEIDQNGARLADNSIIGFFCTGNDAGDGGDNYAMVNLAYNRTDHCVVYNGVDVPVTPGDDDDDTDGGNGGGGNGGSSGGSNGGGGNGGGGRGGGSSDPSPDINLTGEIMGDSDLPGMPQTGGGGSMVPLVIFGAIAIVGAVRSAWKR